MNTWGYCQPHCPLWTQIMHNIHRCQTANVVRAQNTIRNPLIPTLFSWKMIWQQSMTATLHQSLMSIWAVRFYDNLHLFQKTVPTAGVYCCTYRVTEKSHNPDGNSQLTYHSLHCSLTWDMIIVIWFLKLSLNVCRM
jgi:hypothetical protein